MMRDVMKATGIVTVVVGFAILNGGLGAADACVTDWGEASAIVRSERLTTVEDLATHRAAGVNGQIVKATLCREADRYVYRLVVRDGSGTLRAMTVRADSPVKAATPR